MSECGPVVHNRSNKSWDNEMVNEMVLVMASASLSRNDSTQWETEKKAPSLQTRVGNWLFKLIEAITMPWCDFHYLTPINKPFKPIRSRVEQNSYTAFTRPFSFRPNIKEEKWSGHARLQYWLMAMQMLLAALCFDNCWGTTLVMKCKLLFLWKVILMCLNFELQFWNWIGHDVRL